MIGRYAWNMIYEFYKGQVVFKILHVPTDKIQIEFCAIQTENSNIINIKLKN